MREQVYFWYTLIVSCPKKDKLTRMKKNIIKLELKSAIKIVLKTFRDRI